MLGDEMLARSDAGGVVLNKPSPSTCKVLEVFLLRRSNDARLLFWSRRWRRRWWVFFFSLDTISTRYAARVKSRRRKKKVAN